MQKKEILGVTTREYLPRYQSFCTVTMKSSFVS